MLIKKKVLKRLMDIKKLFLLVGAFVLALFSGSVSAVLLGGALDINLQDENSKQQELTTINLNSDELTIPVVPVNSSPPMPSQPNLAIPLPAAFPLMISGLAGLGLLGWARSKK